jgi:ppGpp synthetase/RelA/SpoT-type nucleotidyltranferase
VGEPTIEWTKSQIARLGKNLLASDPPSDAYLQQLQSLLQLYDEALETATSRIQDNLGTQPTSRLKTTGTLIEKLKKSGGRSLPNIQDVAGTRIVLDGTLGDQTELSESLRSLFADGSKPPRIMDRREEPMYGYRAVHVVVYVGGLPVEIQVRTKVQDQWANAFEKFADVVGRGIRYGEEPDEWTILMNKSLAQISSDESRIAAERALEHDSSDSITKQKMFELLASENFVDNTVGGFMMAANNSYLIEQIKGRHWDDMTPEQAAKLEEAQSIVQSSRQTLEHTVERILDIRTALMSMYPAARDAAVQALVDDGQDLTQMEDGEMKQAIVRASVRILHESD